VSHAQLSCSLNHRLPLSESSMTVCMYHAACSPSVWLFYQLLQHTGTAERPARQRYSKHVGRMVVVPTSPQSELQLMFLSCSPPPCPATRPVPNYFYWCYNANSGEPPAARCHVSCCSRSLTSSATWISQSTVDDVSYAAYITSTAAFSACIEYIPCFHHGTST
jgi:hypothetical protein